MWGGGEGGRSGAGAKDPAPDPARVTGGWDKRPWTAPRIPGPDSGKGVAERTGGGGWESFMRELALEVGLE